MSEFSAAANLEVTVPDSELRSAKSRIESELGDVSVGVDSMAPDGGTARPGTSRGQRAGILDASRKSLEEQQTLVELAEERNELLDDLLDGGLGAGGGGGGSTNIIPAGIPSGGSLKAAGMAGLRMSGVGAASLGIGMITDELLGVEPTGSVTAPGAPGQELPGRATFGEFMQNFGQPTGSVTAPTGEFDFEWPEAPEWVSDPLGQVPEAPDWFGATVGMVPDPPDWFDAQLGDVPGPPDWFDDTLGSAPEAPEWMTNAPEITFDVPPELEQLAAGNVDLGSLDITFGDIGLDLPSTSELEREIGNAVESKFADLERDLKRELERRFDVRNLLG